MTHTLKIVNCTTGEEVEREATANEIKVIEADAAASIAAKATLEAKATAKAALLNRLGITEDEAKFLLS